MAEQAALFEDFAVECGNASSSSPPTDEAGAEKDGAASGPPALASPESGAAPSSDFSLVLLSPGDAPPPGTSRVTAVITAAMPLQNEVLLYLAMGESAKPRVQCVAVTWEEIDALARLSERRRAGPCLEPRRWRGWALVTQNHPDMTRRPYPYVVCESLADAEDLQDPGEEIVVVEVVEIPKEERRG